jgi:nucleoside-diphosphate-sugar epimerase
VRIYLTDASRLYALTDWRPQRSAEQTLADIAAWVREHEPLVVSALGPS